LAIVAQTRNEDAVPLHPELPLDLGDGLSDQAAALDAVRPRDEHAVARSGVAFADDAHLLLERLALRRRVDAESLRPEPGEKSQRGDHAEKIRDGECDCGVGEDLRLRRGLERKAVDRVAAGAEGCRFGEAAGEQPHRRPGVEAESPGERVTGAQADARENQRERDLGQPARSQSAEELRAGAVADREEKQQEERRLEVAGYLDPELADDHARDESPPQGAEGQRAQAYPAYPVAEREREKQRHLRVMAQRLDEPVPHAPGPPAITSARVSPSDPAPEPCPAPAPPSTPR